MTKDWELGASVPGLVIPLSCGRCRIGPNNDFDGSGAYAYTVEATCSRHSGLFLLLLLHREPTQAQAQRFIDDSLEALKGCTWHLDLDDQRMTLGGPTPVQLSTTIIQRKDRQ